ncbi:transcription antitermination factor NusB [Nitratidesulfovibrio liaohensis]|uniref:Sun protein n=1 Tax=Nitratidesulfovibrio liaohensis TaxID=2604158 RepID=A0ABY9QYZ5_9BACT|nr:transcription antitermination factor NusB [Nitratidesulfovibrio liaohensis]WMW64276.1 sun protein [Nitratidesulfovibrio liaohensis]
MSTRRLQPRAKGPSLPPARAAALAALDKVLRKGQEVQAALDTVLADTLLADPAARNAAKARAAESDTPARNSASRTAKATPSASTDSALRHAGISRQDAALATELVYGYLRSEIRISWLLRRFLTAPDKLPPEALLTLGVAAHEIVHLDRIPDYAAVDWAVTHISQRFGPGLGKLANAVLRNVARLGDDARNADLYREGATDPREFLSVRHAAPRWLVDLWCDAYGMDRAADLLAASAQAPAPAVRVNAARPGWQALRDTLISDHHGAACGHAGVVFPVGGFPAEVAALERTGLLSRQGAASQEVLDALRPDTWEGPVWDACCGRGGKALALLERGVDMRLCSDPNAGRLRGLRADAERLKLAVPAIVRASATQPPCAAGASSAAAGPEGSGMPILSATPDTKDATARPGTFRTILIDAPCSGTGHPFAPSGHQAAPNPCRPRRACRAARQDT